MGRFFTRLKAAAKGFANASGSSGPARYSAGGTRIRCSHCHAETFRESEAILNTTDMPFMSMNLLDKSGTALICENCGLIQWFARKPERQQT